MTDTDASLRKRSMVDYFLKNYGLTSPDFLIAEQAHCSKEFVKRRRKALGVAPFIKQARKG